MNVLIAFLKNHPGNTFLYFDDWKNAEKARNFLITGVAAVDDYGQSLFVPSGELAGVLVADVDKQLQAQAEVSKKQMAAQQRMGAGLVQMPRPTRMA